MATNPPIPLAHQYVVYINPRDFPGMYVVRRFAIFPGRAEPDAQPLYAGLRLDEARRAIPTAGLYRVPRQAADDSCIVEVWL